MKHLVVPTDFSKNSKNALNFAINIANQYEECTIHLLNMYQVTGGTGVMHVVTDFIKKQADDSLTELVRKVKTDLKQGTEIVPRSIEGKPVEIIVAYAEKLSADYIVMGTQGASGIKELFWGSNTVGVIKESLVPVMAIPSECIYRPFAKIVLAIDDKILESVEIVEPMIQIAKKFNSNVKVLHVGNEKAKASIDAGVSIYLADINPTFHFVRETKISESIKMFVEKEHTDLLCLIRRERDFISSLFHNSITEKKAYNSEIPLLILHDR